MKNDIIHLFQDERVWESIIEFSDDSLAGDRFVKSQFLVKEIEPIFILTKSRSFFDILEKYEKLNITRSIMKFSKSLMYVEEKISLTEEKKFKIYQLDIKIAQENALKWFKKRWKSDKELTIEYINTNPDSKKVFEEQCFNLWEKRFNSLVLENQKSNYYEFEEKVYTNRHFYLKTE